MLAMRRVWEFPARHRTIAAWQEADQRQIDILSCKDQAQLAIGTAGHQVGDFLLGLTIVGTPIAYESDKQTERDVFARCMHERGYNVVPPKE
jgi:hypothetical protein